jgi:hypothetical protein
MNEGELATDRIPGRDDRCVSRAALAPFLRRLGVPEENLEQEQSELFLLLSHDALLLEALQSTDASLRIEPVLDVLNIMEAAQLLKPVGILIDCREKIFLPSLCIHLRSCHCSKEDLRLVAFVPRGGEKLLCGWEFDLVLPLPLVNGDAHILLEKNRWNTQEHEACVLL